MASSLRLISRCWLKVVRPVTDTTSVRSLSETTTILADKKPTKASKPAAPPKPPAAASPASTKGDTYQAQEIFEYNVMSYYEMESDMRKSRLPQPKPGQPSD
ncbi:uncharacterized protein LOC105444460 [Strongylocentrotus purpuratus]|uniref:Complex I-9kD n=1 Tax=Strongylocentrotus purpuratus TaxID=7668 RepID=A0A7M7HNV0_STRPU|nr:uncharacterized protein LOC105444460 [Strongylocentrotus purpuratus]|eukprot:XP_011677041.1 PREDICTED: uncharacterized protein LOC105444460 [Strongylocentrotus purpuratus]